MERATFSLLQNDGEFRRPGARASYEADIHAWAVQQAELIRLRRFDELDLENLADEVEDVARREREELESRLILLFQHLVTRECRRERRSASWARTIREQRRQVNNLLDEAPSLRTRLVPTLDEAFKQGRVAALNGTRLADHDVAEANPFTRDQVLVRPVVWPET